jgi:hypothetical protein
MTDVRRVRSALPSLPARVPCTSGPEPRSSCWGRERADPVNTVGAAYDPGTDTWRRIADAPVRLILTSGVRTGDLRPGSVGKQARLVERHLPQREQGAGGRR